jgi:cytochrome c553
VRRAAGLARLSLAAMLAAAPAPSASLAERLVPCLACHGASGQSTTDNVPSLGGQQPTYTLVQLYLFREKLRVLEPMNLMTQGLSDDDLRQFSEFLAALPKPPAPADLGDPQRMRRAQSLTVEQHCVSCHNPDFSGQNNIPRLADQREDYLAKAMREYKNNSRPGYDGTMSEVMQVVSDASIGDLAYYLARVR